MNKSIQDQTIKEILHNIDLVELIGEYIQVKKSGKNYLAICPFHTEKTPSFSVSAEKQFYHCFGCGASGNAIRFLMDIEGISFVESVQKLAAKAGIYLQNIPQHLESFSAEKRGQETEWMFKAHHLANQLFHHVLLERNEGSVAQEYLFSRGFQPETIREFQLGFAPDSWDFLTSFLEKRDYPLEIVEQGGLLSKKTNQEHYFDRFRNRIMFPIADTKGRTIAFGGRALDQSTPKYLNTTETAIFKKGKILFNFHRARQSIRQTKQAVLFEGYVDVISAWQAGIENGVASLGTSLSNDQARILVRHAEQVIICYDGDQAGLEAAIRAAEILEQFECLVKVASMPDGQDPDDFIRQHGAERFQREILAEAKTFTAFRLEMLRKGKNLQDEGEKIHYVGEAVKVISQLKRAVERDHYLRQLSEEFSLSLDALKQEQYQILKQEKKHRERDNQPYKWNNSINSSKHLVAKQLFPAYYNAERILLAYMLKDMDWCQRIEKSIGSQFKANEHNALAAYLYAYYAAGNQTDISAFLTFVDDPDLESLIAELSMLVIAPTMTEKEFQDYMQCVLNQAVVEEVEVKEQEKRAAERRGDVVLAAQIAMEILQLKHQRQ